MSARKLQFVSISILIETDYALGKVKRMDLKAIDKLVQFIEYGPICIPMYTLACR